MRMVLASMVGSRAIIAVIALYALCLQTLLGPLALPPLLGGVICAQEASHAPADPNPVCPRSCCILVHAAQMLPAPAAPFATIAWPVPTASRPIRPAVAIAPARAPPDRSVSSRGPPAA